MLGTIESATRNYSVPFLSTTAATIAAFLCTSTHYRVDINFENQISRSITVSIVCVIAIWSRVRGSVFTAQESRRMKRWWVRSGASRWLQANEFWIKYVTSGHDYWQHFEVVTINRASRRLLDSIFLQNATELIEIQTRTVISTFARTPLVKKDRKSVV